LIDGRTVESIFLGGGTPSLLSPEQVARVIEAYRASAATAANAEITLEANPNSVDEAYFAGLLDAGINRLSIGVQTLDRRGLRVLGRQHEASDAKAALDAARSAGFTNVSLDLIFGWPGQTMESWRRDLQTIIGWSARPEHLSLYGLIVEPGTPMADAVARGILTVVDDDASADFYEAAIDVLAGAGFIHYEVANWAQSETHVSRHNTLYWKCGDYLGIGAGAHGTVAGTRSMNHLLPRTYIDAVERNESPYSNSEVLDLRTQMGEVMMLGLRLLNEGVSEIDFRVRFGVGLDDMFADTIAELVTFGLLDHYDGHVQLTHRGLMLANDVCLRFV
jgi:oxygen-independent coproporphyrinogen-3 oxidase